MTRRQSLGPLDPIFNERVKYGAIKVGNSPPPIGNPSVTINKAAGQADPATGGPVLFDVVFSEAVTGFATGSVNLSASTTVGTLVGTVTGAGAVYSVSVAGQIGRGNIVAAIDAGVCVAVSSGLPNQASTSTDNSVAWIGVLLVFDSFNRADNPSVVGNADTGQTWAAPSTGFGGTWGVIGNRAYQSVNAGGGDWSTAMLINSGVVVSEISLDITTAQAGLVVGGGLVFRQLDSANLFILIFNRTSGGATNWYLQREAGGSFNVLASGAGPASLTGSIRVVDDTSTITVLIDGVVSGSGSSPTYNTQTKQGIFVIASAFFGANDATQWRFDNYELRVPA